MTCGFRGRGLSPAERRSKAEPATGQVAFCSRFFTDATHRLAGGSVHRVDLSRAAPAVKPSCRHGKRWSAFRFIWAGDMSKQSMREEAERLVREAMEKRTLAIKQGNTRIDAVCGKCGAPNRLSAERGATRVKFTCKECGHKQETL
jgi:RNA polymerase-binding transcription factor DksA